MVRLIARLAITIGVLAAAALYAAFLFTVILVLSSANRPSPRSSGVAAIHGVEK